MDINVNIRMNNKLNNILIAIDSFTELYDLVQGNKFIDNPKKRINELQDTAAEAIGILNPILDKFARRECYFGTPSRKVDIFRESLTINSLVGCSILKDALAELKMLQSQLRNQTVETVEMTISEKDTKKTKRVFIVHGQNNEIKNTVTLYLTRLGLEPIILHEQEDNGNTIMEKFIEYSDVDFAISLLTPDDKGILNDKKTHRARQNIIFEFGYFMGKLGRKNIVALYEQSDLFEIPSDLSGLIYIPYNSNEDTWKLRLAKELKRVFKIDMNNIK